LSFLTIAAIFFKRGGAAIGVNAASYLGYDQEKGKWRKNMKKWFGIVLLVGLVFLSGCTKLPQEQFAEDLKAQKSVNAGDFSLSVDTFDIEGADLQSSEVGMIFSQLAGAKIAGNFAEDPKSKNIRFESTLTWGEEEVPLNLLIDGKSHESYLSAEMFAKMIDAFAFGNFGDSSQTGEDTFKGKYIQLSPEEMADIDADQLLETNQLFSSEVMSDYIKTLDKDSFKKEGDTITHTFTKQELEGLVEYAKKQDADTSEITQWEELLKDTKSIELTVSVNAKKQNQKVVLNMTQSGDLPVTVGLTFTISGKESDEKVQLPASEDVIDEETLFDSYQEDSLLDDSYEEDTADDWTGYSLTDEEFEQLLAMAPTAVKEMTEDEIAEFLLIYKNILTDKQYQQLSEVLQVSGNL
jgi:hypothetical protein